MVSFEEHVSDRLDSIAGPRAAAGLAAAREPLLRATAPAILAAPRETPVEPAVLANAVNEGFPGRYNARTLQNIGKNAASSWTQAGYLQGRTPKVRVRAEPGST